MNRRKNNSTVPRRLLSLGAVAALPLGALVAQAPASAETARESAVDSLWNVIGNDWDLEGLSNTDEQQRGTDPHHPDSDGDGLTDAQEVNQKLGKGGQSRTCALSKDTDFDGIGDGDEVAAGTEPNISDKPNPRPSRHDLRDHDGDCMPDWDDYSESQTRGRTSDSDGDGLLDGLEFSQGTDANSADTDGDGFTDSQEGFFMIDWAGETRVFQIDPLNPDQDKNGVPDGQEYSLDGMTRA